MKKKFFRFSLLVGLFFFTNTAFAQLTFFNATPCPVKVFGVISTSATPCFSGPYCTSTTIVVNPFSVGTVPNPPCLGPVTPPPTWVRVGVNTTTGAFLGVSICGTASVNYVDCQGNPRTLTQFNGTTAAIF